MARMHSRKKGKSGSSKPAKLSKPSWVSLKPREIEMLIVKLAKEGKTASQIGIYLRDEHGVPDVKVMTGKTITQILAAKKLAPEIPDDLMALLRKAVLVRKHLAENNNDKTAKRGLQLTESKIRRLAKYYIRVGRLESGWKYDPERIKILVE
ncbi:30S ribosomal protein S15 [Candidatus Woesearchaeota archaeon]|nr:MAG: 30S ribosomal protein S15 [Candidatus Woesearchaeota archaeon]